MPSSSSSPALPSTFSQLHSFLSSTAPYIHLILLHFRSPYDSSPPFNAPSLPFFHYPSSSFLLYLPYPSLSPLFSSLLPSPFLFFSFPITPFLPLPLSQGPIESWLPLFERAMCSTLHALCRTALSLYPAAEEGLTQSDWLWAYPAQVLSGRLLRLV